MKKTITSIILLLMFSNSLLAQQGSGRVKILIKDRETGLTFSNDTMQFVVNDSIITKFVSDSQGYAFFYLNQGKYDLGVRHVGYQGVKILGIMIAEGKTSYITFEISNREGKKIKKKKKGGVKLKMVKN